MSESLQIIQGDCLEVLKTLPDESVHCCVTSPPYWGLRDYGVDGQIGLEASIEDYVTKIVEVFREVKRVLRNDGTCWINLGDSYSSGSSGQTKMNRKFQESSGSINLPGEGGRKENGVLKRDKVKGVKPKQLLGIPWRVAFALQNDGWFLRQDIIWHKPNPMPESVTDRCTKAHEYIFLLTKSARYYFDNEAIKVPIKDTSVLRLKQNLDSQKGSHRVPGKTNGPMKAVCKEWNPRMAGGAIGIENRKHHAYPNANKRSVWSVTTKGFKGAHFATYPPDLIKPCILSGCPVNGTVLDPFAGSGTTGQVALENGRKAILIELNPDYIKLINERCASSAVLELA